MSEVLKQLENGTMIYNKEDNSVTITYVEDMVKIILNKSDLETMTGIICDLMTESLEKDIKRMKDGIVLFGDILQNNPEQASALQLSEDIIKRMKNYIKTLKITLSIIKLIKTDEMFKLR